MSENRCETHLSLRLRIVHDNWSWLLKLQKFYKPQQNLKFVFYSKKLERPEIKSKPKKNKSFSKSNNLNYLYSMKHLQERQRFRPYKLCLWKVILTSTSTQNRMPTVFLGPGARQIGKVDVPFERLKKTLLANATWIETAHELLEEFGIRDTPPTSLLDWTRSK